MLEFKDDPQKLIVALEEFLSVYYADRQLEYQRELDEILSGNIPKPLKYLYPFIEKYFGKHGNLCKQDSLRINSVKKTYGGKTLIVSENSGCWHCFTETEGEDPPVWTEDYGWKDDFPKWKLVNNSLSQFLVTFCLREALFNSVYSYRIKKKMKNVLSEFKKQKYETVLLWQGKYFPVEDYVMPQTDYFYLIEDSILVWDMWNSSWCGTNYKNADRLLSLIQSELR